MASKRGHDLDDEQFLREFRDKMKRKRQGTDKETIQGLKLGEIQVRRFTANPQGVNKWYRPLGASQFLTLEAEATLKNLKQVIADFEDVPPHHIDILTSKEGPSATNEKHLAQGVKEKRFMYRVVPTDNGSSSRSQSSNPMGHSSKRPGLSRYHSNSKKLCLQSGNPMGHSIKGCGLSLNPSKRLRPQSGFTVGHPSKGSDESSNPSKKSCSEELLKKFHSPAPLSLSIDEILGMGTVVGSKVFSNVAVSEFSAEKSAWLPRSSMLLMIEQESFSEGAFKEVFKAATDTNDNYVIKRFKDIAKKSGIKIHGHQLREQIKITVQTQAVARYYAEKFSALTPNHSLCYAPLYMGEMDNDVFLIEQFIDSNEPFTKYINNNGTILKGNDPVAQRTAKAFTHYTYQSSSKELMVTDVQGWFPNLIDPAIATSAIKRNGKYQFGLDNLGPMAITTFSKKHICSSICFELGLHTLVVGEDSSGSDYSLKEIVD